MATILWAYSFAAAYGLLGINKESSFEEVPSFTFPYNSEVDLVAQSEPN